MDFDCDYNQESLYGVERYLEGVVAGGRAGRVLRESDTERERASGQSVVVVDHDNPNERRTTGHGDRARREIYERCITTQCDLSA